MTLTTVGYELSPVTVFGKIIGGMCALSGIFILTLPIPIVVNSFASYYKNRMWRTEVAHKKRERIKDLAKEKKEMQKMMLFKVTNMINIEDEQFVKHLLQTMAMPGCNLSDEILNSAVKAKTENGVKNKNELVVFNPSQSLVAIKK